MPLNLSAVVRNIEYGRYYTQAELTEDGAYVFGSVPSTYAGSFIAEIEVCYAVVFTDITGKITLTTYNPPDLKDEDGLTGLAILHPDGRALREDTAGSATPIQLEWRQNDNIDDALASHVSNTLAMAMREFGEWYI